MLEIIIIIIIFFFVISDMLVCKLIVKFTMPLTSLIKRSVQPFEKKKIIFFIKFWAFYNGEGSFFYGVIFCCYCGGGGALTPRPKLPTFLLK